MTILTRPRAKLSVGELTDVTPDSGSAGLDSGRVPYARATVAIPLVSAALVETIDPRENQRGLIVAGDDEVGRSRIFDLGLRSREVDHKARTITLEFASDEAMLQDFAPLLDDATPREHEASLRGLVGYVLDQVDAVLEPGDPDPDLTATWDAENLFTDPRYARTPGGGYGQSGISTIVDTTWVASEDIWGVHLHTPTASDSYVSLSNAGTGLPYGLKAGETYVFAATGSVRAAMGGAVYPGRDRRLCVFVRPDPSVGFTMYASTEVPNVAESGASAGTRVAVEFTIPDTPTAEIQIRAYHGASSGSITWRAFQMGKRRANITVDQNGQFVCGQTPDSAAYRYDWNGTQDLSASSRKAVAARPPELFIWRAGDTAWAFLEPLTSAAGLRLFCDETRRWRLIDPAVYSIPGRVTLGTWNVNEGSDRITREDADVYATGVVVKYSWEDDTGAARTAIDSAGTPGRVFVVTLNRPYPGPGAAAAMLSRRSGQGRTQTVSAVTDWTATPAQEVGINLPGAESQIGQLAVVEWDLKRPLMRIGSTGLTDAAPGTWLAWDPEEEWEDVEPTDLMWEEL